MARSGLVLVDQHPALLIRDHDIQRPSIEKIRHSHGTPIEPIRYARLLGNIHEPSSTGVQQHARALVPRETRAADRRPVLGVLEDVALRPSDLGHRIPVVAPRVRRDESVRHDQIEQPVVVQVAELRAPRPPRVGDDAARDFVEPAQLLEKVEAQVVALKQKPLLRDVGDEHVVLAAVVHVPHRDRHAALGIVLEPCARQLEALPRTVQEQLLRPVVIGEIEVGPAVVVEVGRGGRQRPARTAHPHRVGHVGEAAMP